MLKISLRNFLETGNFGPVTLGHHRDVVRSLLGKPDDVSVETNQQGKSKIWKYGDIEFYFDDLGDCLNMIFSDDFKIPMGGNNFDLDPWILNSQLSPGEAVNIMFDNDIILQETHLPNEEEGRYLKTGANVRLAFSGDDNERLFLHSFWIMQEVDTKSG